MNFATPLLDHAASRAAWEVHQSAAVPARTAGACRSCCAEVGCRATDAAGMYLYERRKPAELHQECMRRIARGEVRSK